MPLESALQREPAAQPGIAETAKLRCLWLARYLPYPLDAGAKVYSARLALSLAAAGAYVRFLGFGDRESAARAEAGIDWRAIPGTRRSPVAALWSSLPVAAAVDATDGYRRLLKDELRESWDVIVFDGYGTGWALKDCKARYGGAAGVRRPLLVHVSHNHEAAVWTAMANEARSSPVRRLALVRNSRRIRDLERELLVDSDLVTTITEEDREEFASVRPPDRPMLTLSPGFTGWIAPPRTITVDTPRRVLLLGSFHWVVKRDNLARFVATAEPQFGRAGITLDVVGDVPADLLAALKPRTTATHFHGYVDDVAPFFAQARMACVPEQVGGGFKLKFLDYFFGRLPVATIGTAAAGLPAGLRRETFCCNDLESLAATLVRHIDSPERLNAMQARAFEHARDAFRWDERGRRLHAAILELRGRAGLKPGKAFSGRSDS